MRSLCLLPLAFLYACASASAAGRAGGGGVEDPSSCEDNAEATKAGVPNQCEAAAAMRSLEAEIAPCSAKPGTAHVVVIFDPYGMVRDAQVDGEGYDADALLCVKGHALRAKIRPFKAAEFKVDWQFHLGRS